MHANRNSAGAIWACVHVCVCAARDASIDAPAGPAPAVPGGWHLIDSYSVIDCVVSPCGHISDVPAALQTDWARARVEVFDVISAARSAGIDEVLARSAFSERLGQILSSPPATTPAGPDPAE